MHKLRRTKMQNWPNNDPIHPRLLTIPKETNRQFCVWQKRFEQRHVKVKMIMKKRSNSKVIGERPHLNISLSQLQQSSPRVCIAYAGYRTQSPTHIGSSRWSSRCSQGRWHVHPNFWWDPSSLGATSQRVLSILWPTESNESLKPDCFIWKLTEYFGEPQ